MQVDLGGDAGDAPHRVEVFDDAAEVAQLIGAH